MKLPKKYIKQFGGINKAAWTAYKKTLKPRAKARVKKAITKAKTGGKKRMKNKKFITNQYLRGAAIDFFGDIAAPRVGVDARLAKAGVSYYMKEKALTGAYASQFIRQGGVFTGEGAVGKLGEWL